MHTTEYGIQPKSRIRSFKKYISEKDFPINSVIQTEIDFPNNQSIFAGSIQDELHLKSNQIKNIPEDISWGLLYLLDLSYNKITNLPKEFGKNEINVLNVSHNELTTLPDRLGV